MKKQKFQTIILGICILACTSCNDFLVVSSNSLLSDDVVYSNPDSTIKAIASIYEIVGENNSYRNRLWLQMGINTDIEYRSGWDGTKVAPLSITKADDFLALYNSKSDMSDGNYNDPSKANPWSLLYQGIERANLAIDGIRKFGKPEAGNDMGHLLGEALTMRAFFYYDLVKWWGDVPARFEPVNLTTIYLAKSNRDTIYNHIIKDLQEASTILYSPGKALSSTTKRVSKDAARGLLARVCLSAAGYSMRPLGATDSEIKITATPERQKELYTIAREACRSIITDNHYKLEADFKNIFFQQCQDNETHGREAIWQLPYSMGLRGRMVYNLGLPRDPDGKNTTQTIGGQFKVMPSFFYDYDVNDARRDVTVVPYSVKKHATLGYMQDSLSSGVTGFNIAKWRAEWVKSPITSTDDGVSPIVLRYADVLLMFAEADLVLGGSEGQNYFNMVRRRAFKQDINSTSPYDLTLTMDNLKAERAFEFCGENIRKYDLERWGQLKSSINKAKDNLRALRDGTGRYADVPQTIYYRYQIDNTITPGEHVVIVYGLQRGENLDKKTLEPGIGWNSKSWTQATSSTTGEYYLSEGYIINLTAGDPDKRQLIPIFHQTIITSNNSLSNDYGYGN